MKPRPYEDICLHPPAPTSTRVDALEKRVKKLEALVAKLRKGPIRGGGQEFYK